MEITAKLLRDNFACMEGRKAFSKNFGKEGVPLRKALNKCLELHHADWALWLLTRFLDREQSINYTLFAAETILPLFEKVFSSDKRMRSLIKAVKQYLKRPGKKTKEAVRAATFDARNAACSFLWNTNKHSATKTISRAISAADFMLIEEKAFDVDAMIAAGRAAVDALLAAQINRIVLSVETREKLVDYGMECLEESK
jgi:hypothetical protein